MLLEVTSQSLPHGFALLTDEERQQLKEEVKGALSPYAVQMLNLKKEEKEIDQRIQEIDQKITASKLRQAAAEQKIKKIENDKKNLIVKAFYGIFNGKNPLPREEVDTIFQKYLSDGSISLEKGPETCIIKLNSMKAVTHYLDDHPNVKICNFRPFEAHDIKTLAEYLAQSSCQVTGIGISRNISIEEKESLDKAMQRRPSLKVTYLN
jgi:hypothetical protein